MRAYLPGVKTILLTALTALALAPLGCSDGDGDDPLVGMASAGLALPAGSGPYTFGANIGSNKCLDVAGGKSDPGTKIQIYDCNGTAGQSFWVENQGGASGNVRFVNTGSNNCLDVDNAGTADGTKVQLYPCNVSGSQLFRIEDGGSGRVKIVNPQSGKCLDVAQANTANGTSLQIYTCNGTNAQLWTPTSIAPSPRRVTGASVSGDTVHLTLGEDQLNVRMVKPEILSIDYMPGGASSPKTLVVDPAKTWPAGSVLSVDANADPITITSSKMVVKIKRDPSRISIYDTSGNLLLKEQDAEGLYGNGVNFNHSAGETFYGIGGYDAWADSSAGMMRNSGGHVTAGSQGWAGAPFVFTKKYGVMVDSGLGDFFIDPTRLEFSNASKKDIDVYVVVGEPKTVMQGFAEISGKPPMSPKWTMGFMNTEWGASETEVSGIIDTYRSKSIPLDGFIFDFDWKAWGEDNYGEWRWNSTSGPGSYDPNKFPNGASGVFASRMATRGVKLGGITKPRILVQNASGAPTAAAQYATDHGYWFPWQQSYTDYFSGRQAKDLNFAVADCRSWYWSHFKDAYDAGIVAWWNDEADTLGPSGDNFQFLNMQRGAYDWQRGYSGKRVWSINRNFFLGSQRYGYAVWSGDINTGFANMAAQRDRLLSAVNVGAVKWSMDTGGFFGTPSSENYARWMQFSSMVPLFRVHGVQNEQRQPWVYGPIAEAAAKNAAYRRYQLLPYIYAYDRSAYENGLGLVRPLFYEFVNDRNVENTTESWMLGDYLLASPVVEQGQTTKSIYLPAGTWYDITKGTAYVGPQSIAYPVNNSTWEDAPLFIRKGAIIPTQETQNWIGERSIDKVYVDVFADSAQTSFTYYDDDGETYTYEGDRYFKQLITARDTGASGIQLNIDAKRGSYTPPALRNYIVKIHGKAGDSVKVNDASATRFGDKLSLESSSGEGWATGTDVFGDVTYVKVAVGATKRIVVTGDAAPGQAIYEAEEAVLQGGASINKNHAGYAGTGFVDGFWAQNATTKFHVRVPTAGTYPVSLRYANATGSAKTLNVYVNGRNVGTTSLASLASWDSWGNQVEALDLAVGENIISYQVDAGNSGNVNLDYISLPVGDSRPQSVSPTYYRIKNRWTGDYMHIEELDPNGKIEYGSLPAGSWSSHWSMISEDGYTRFVNRWTGDVLNIESQKGWLEFSGVPDYYVSSQWTLEDVQGFKRLRNRWKADVYAHIEDRLGYVEYGNLPDTDLSTQWSFEQAP